MLRAQVNTDQGNPAHVYQYGKTFVLANDAKNGFTTTNAAKLRAATEDGAKFHAGGSGHITLAVVDDRVAYATWIAREGDDCGRVDVVGLGDNQGKRYAVHCPTGGLHGATTNSGKVFFAPADGICWVDADLECDDTPDAVEVHYLPLGKADDETPLRTGAFENLDQRVPFTAGDGEHAKLCWIDASSDAPTVDSLSLKPAADESLTTPMAIRSRTGKAWIVMFRESKNAPKTDSLVVVEVDADRDGHWDDAAVAHTIEIGRIQIEIHSGHHEAAQLPSGRQLLITNPADGTLSVISLADWSIAATLSVGGTPTRVVAIGD